MYEKGEYEYDAYEADPVIRCCRFFALDGWGKFSYQPGAYTEYGEVKEGGDNIELMSMIVFNQIDLKLSLIHI